MASSQTPFSKVIFTYQLHAIKPLGKVTKFIMVQNKNPLNMVNFLVIVVMKEGYFFLARLAIPQKKKSPRKENDNVDLMT